MGERGGTRSGEGEILKRGDIRALLVFLNFNQIISSKSDGSCREGSLITFGLFVASTLRALLFRRFRYFFNSLRFEFRRLMTGAKAKIRKTSTKNWRFFLF